MIVSLGTLVLAIQLLILLLIANGAPLIAKRLLGERWAWPLDANLRFFDGKPVLGPSKTWRGLLAAVISCGLTAWVFGFSWTLGATFGAAAMLGDSLSSFIKRRLNIPSGGMALALDQIPEALLPLWICQQSLDLSGWSVVLLTVLFSISVLVVSRVLFALGIRDTPY